jgi:hypothetical protein
MLLVDDGSSDETHALMQRAAAEDPHIRVLQLSENQGKGGAVRAGVLASRGTKILFMDADGSISPDHIPEMVRLLDAHPIVTGDRHHPDSIIRQPPLRSITRWGFNGYVRCLFDTGVRDHLCGFKGFQRTAALQIFQDLRHLRWTFDVEILARARLLGLTVTTLPITWTYREGSKFRPWDPLVMMGRLICLRYHLANHRAKNVNGHPLFFLVPFAFFLGFPSGGFYALEGDSICQVAYWKILFRDHLQGSIGAAQTKPGLMLLLGIAHDSSQLLFGAPDILIKPLLAFFTSWLCFEMARLAETIAGSRKAGIAALALAMAGHPLRDVLGWTSQLFFLPLTLTGVRLAIQGKLTWSAVALGCAALFRLEATGAMVLLFCYQWLHRSTAGRRPIWITGSLIGILLLIQLMTIQTVQGHLSRISSSYPAGYGYEDIEMAGNIGRVLTQMTHAVGSRFYRTPLILSAPLVLLLLPAMMCILFIKHTRNYLWLAGIISGILVLNACFAGGAMTSRYFVFVDVLIISVGSGGLFLKHSGLKAGKAGPKTALLLTILVLAYSITWGYGPWREEWRQRRTPLPAGPGRPLYEALSFVEAPHLPRRSRVMGEDDILYTIMTKHPDYFSWMLAIQSFNVMKDSERKEVLKKLDYIWISKGKYPWYYLNYVPVPLWRDDPFRCALLETMRGATVRIYNHHLVPIINDEAKLVIKITNE